MVRIWLPCTSRRCSWGTSRTSFILLPGVVKSTSCAEVISGSSSILFASRHSSCSFGKAQTDSGKVLRKFPLRYRCVSPVNKPTSGGSSVRLLEIKHSVSRERANPISLGSLSNSGDADLRCDLAIGCLAIASRYVHNSPTRRMSKLVEKHANRRCRNADVETARRSWDVYGRETGGFGVRPFRMHHKNCAMARLSLRSIFHDLSDGVL